LSHRVLWDVPQSHGDTETSSFFVIYT
jgi:hypothetical protein